MRLPRSFPTSDASPQNLAPRMRDSTIHEEFFFLPLAAVRNKRANHSNKSLPLEKIYGIYIRDHRCKKWS